MFEFILFAKNKLPRLAQNRTNESNENFLERLQEVRKVAQDLSTSRDENGIYKRVSETPFTLLNMKKYIVKTNTKLLQRPELAERMMTKDMKKETLKVCDELAYIMLP